MKQSPLSVQQLAGLLFLRRQYAKGLLSAAGYADGVRLVFCEAGRQEWYARQLQKFQQRPGLPRCLPHRVMSLLTSAAKRRLFPQKWLAREWVQHVCRVIRENPYAGFRILSSPASLDKVDCLVITHAEERGEHAPQLSAVVAALRCRMRVATLIIGGEGEEAALAEASDVCLHLPGARLNPAGDTRYSLLRQLYQSLSPACILTDTLCIYAFGQIPELLGIATVATLYLPPGSPLYYEWNEQVQESLRQREYLMHAYRNLTRVVFASQELADTYRQHISYDIPEAEVLPLPQEKAGLAEYAGNLVNLAGLREMLAERKRLVRRLQARQFPLWQQVNELDELGRYRQKMDALKPYFGFHPLTYAEEHGISAVEALEACLDSPEPLYNYEALDLAQQSSPGEGIRGLVALHIHAFYADILDDILQRVAINTTRPDVYISTSDEAMPACREVCERHGVCADIRVFPNVGRDIGPFLTGFADVWPRYDFVGHVHTKKSPQADADGVERWRKRLYANLLGYQEDGTMDKLLACMEARPRCGLLFPDLARSPEWNANYPVAQRLMERMGYSAALPRQLLFPGGTMFWCRPAALRALFSAGLDWADYPAEPLDIDGTSLHALERLFSVVAQQEGYTLAATHLSEVTDFS